MGPSDVTVPPWVIVTAVDRFLPVVKLKITENPRALRIGGANLAAAMNKAVGLVEISRLGHVGRDHPVILTALLDAVYLNRE
jgi:hypothetical protein